MKHWGILGGMLLAALSVAACSRSPVERNAVSAMDEGMAENTSLEPASNGVIDVPSRETRGCSARLLRAPLDVRAAPKAEAPMLIRLEAGAPIFLCEAESNWQRLLFAEPTPPGTEKGERKPSQYNDCLTRPTSRLCRSGWFKRPLDAATPG